MEGNRRENELFEKEPLTADELNSKIPNEVADTKNNEDNTSTLSTSLFSKSPPYELECKNQALTDTASNETSRIVLLNGKDSKKSEYYLKRMEEINQLFRDLDDADVDTSTSPVSNEKVSNCWCDMDVDMDTSFTPSAREELPLPAEERAPQKMTFSYVELPEELLAYFTADQRKLYDQQALLHEALKRPNETKDNVEAENAQLIEDDTNEDQAVMTECKTTSPIFVSENENLNGKKKKQFLGEIQLKAVIPESSMASPIVIVNREIVTADKDSNFNVAEIHHVEDIIGESASSEAVLKVLSVNDVSCLQTFHESYPIPTEYNEDLSTPILGQDLSSISALRACDDDLALSAENIDSDASFSSLDHFSAHPVTDRITEQCNQSDRERLETPKRLTEINENVNSDDRFLVKDSGNANEIPSLRTELKQESVYETSLTMSTCEEDLIPLAVNLCLDTSFCFEDFTMEQLSNSPNLTSREDDPILQRKDDHLDTAFSFQDLPLDLPSTSSTHALNKEDSILFREDNKQNIPFSFTDLPVEVLKNTFLNLTTDSSNKPEELIKWTTNRVNDLEYDLSDAASDDDDDNVQIPIEISSESEDEHPCKKIKLESVHNTCTSFSPLSAKKNPMSYGQIKYLPPPTSLKELSWLKVPGGTFLTTDQFNLVNKMFQGTVQEQQKASISCMEQSETSDIAYNIASTSVDLASAPASYNHSTSWDKRVSYTSLHSMNLDNETAAHVEQSALCDVSQSGGYVQHALSSVSVLTTHSKKRKAEGTKPSKDAKQRKITPFVCLVCNNCYSSKGSLDRHIETHNAVKIYVCPLFAICGEVPGTADKLRKHLMTHPGEYSCTQCLETFYSQACLNTHVKSKHVSAADFPHVCGECQKRFSAADPLRRHMLTHSNEKPFQCPHCPKRMTQKCNLIKHIKSRHSDNLH